MRFATMVALLAAALAGIYTIAPQPASCAGSCSGLCVVDKNCTDGGVCKMLPGMPRGRCKSPA